MKYFLMCAIAVHAAFTLSFVAQDAFSKEKVDVRDELNFLHANLQRGMKAHNLLVELLRQVFLPALEDHEKRLAKLEKHNTI